MKPVLLKSVNKISVPTEKGSVMMHIFAQGNYLYEDGQRLYFVEKYFYPIEYDAPNPMFGQPNEPEMIKVEAEGKLFKLSAPDGNNSLPIQMQNPTAETPSKEDMRTIDFLFKHMGVDITKEGTPYSEDKSLNFAQIFTNVLNIDKAFGVTGWTSYTPE